MDRVYHFPCGDVLAMREFKLKYFLRGVASTVYVFTAVEMREQGATSAGDMVLMGFLMVGAILQALTVFTKDV